MYEMRPINAPVLVTDALPMGNTTMDGNVLTGGVTNVSAMPMQLPLQNVGAGMQYTPWLISCKCRMLEQECNLSEGALQQQPITMGQSMQPMQSQQAMGEKNEIRCHPDQGGCNGLVHTAMGCFTNPSSRNCRLGEFCHKAYISGHFPESQAYQKGFQFDGTRSPVHGK